MKLNRKKTLITSLIAMILCMVMLAGATYAAFSDSANVGIQIGSANFDMQLSYTATAVDNITTVDVDGLADRANATENDGTIVLSDLAIDGTWTEKYYLFEVNNVGDTAFNLDVDIAVENDQEDAVNNAADVLNFYYAGAATVNAITFNAASNATATDVVTASAIAATTGVYYVGVKVTCADTLASGVYSTMTVMITFNAVQG